MYVLEHPAARFLLFAQQPPLEKMPEPGQFVLVKWVAGKVTDVTPIPYPPKKDGAPGRGLDGHTDNPVIK
jgi:hypothetical protein